MKLLFGLVIVSNIAFGQDADLIGGQPAKPGEFPEVVYIASGNSRCSATIIGPRVIVTAGHCVADGGSIKNANFTVGQIVFTAVCKQAPLYRKPQKEDHDMALCKTDKDIPVKYASVGTDKPVKKDQLVTLMGYGCVKPGGGGGNDGVLRVGEAKVTAVPYAKHHWYHTRGASALCFGDSGGPSFVKVSKPKEEHHYIIGVNSRGDIREESLLTALYIEPSKAFFREYAESEKVEICGVNKDCADSEDNCADEKGRLEEAQKAYDQCRAGGK